MSVEQEFDMRLEEYLTGQGLDVSKFSDDEWERITDEFCMRFENHMDRCADQFFEFDGREIREFAEDLL